MEAMVVYKRHHDYFQRIHPIISFQIISVNSSIMIGDTGNQLWEYPSPPKSAYI